MKIVKMNFAVNYVKTVAITMSLLGCLISSVAPPASAQIGFTVGNGGTILRTSNGTEWNAQIYGVPNVNLNSVAAIPSTNGAKAWVVGESALRGGPGTILYNQGSENNWIPQNNTDVGNLNGVYFVDSKHGWAVGDGGLILFSNGTGENGWVKQASTTTQHLYGVSFITRKDGALNGWAVGANGTILFYDGKLKQENKWSEVKGSPFGGGTFRSVSAWCDPLTDRVEVYAAGGGNLGVWKWETLLNGRPWKKLKGQPSRNPDLTAVLVFSPANVWLGQALATEATVNVFNWIGGAKWLDRSPGMGAPAFGSVYGLSSPKDNKKIWVVGPNGHIGSWNNGTWSRQDTGAQQLKGIVMLPAQKKPVSLEGSTSPNSGAVDTNYVSVTGSGFPGGDVNPANVVVELATGCRGAASAITSAVSVISGSGDSKSVSFLLPSGLVSGQYFVSISDSEEGNANFESSNCSAVKVAE